MSTGRRPTVTECVVVGCDRNRDKANYCLACYRRYVLADTDNGGPP